mmetsp:Transcript_2598/g.3531  ORF Transcript_2598/g.3531 Transcript_2598/m.3531 type:complete len:337 (-) Transcript_2598:28-1038(-)
MLLCCILLVILSSKGITSLRHSPTYSTCVKSNRRNISTKLQMCEVKTKRWTWKGSNIRYQVAGEDSNGPPMLLVHGFGGNAQHFRNNIPILGKVGPTYSIDLLGYGYSDKPDPGPWERKNEIYNFENWADQVLDFIDEVVGEPSFVVCNSVGGCVGLQASVEDKKSLIRGLVLFNISLRMLHTSKQLPVARPFVTLLQYVLRETFIGPAFFSSVAKKDAVRSILRQCYGDPNTVTDELVDVILKPGLEPNASKVFLDFISYSGGPLPEDLLPKIKVPVLIGWGDADPWEPIEKGRMYADFKCVEDFIALPGVGHCPQCEAPNLVNPMVINFVQKHS